MIVDSHNMEFTPELFGVLPYAYHHYKHGTLEGTRSATGTEPFYYFSTNHVINTEPRYWGNIDKCIVPNIQIEQFTGQGAWQAPPLKAKYMNTKYVYDKPIVVVSNKYNREWNHDPVNFLDIDTLLKIFDALHDRFTIFYNRLMPDDLYDDQTRVSLGEYPFIRRLYPEVRFIHELEGDYNLNQLSVYANAERFISVQGGNSVLCSYFGGVNIIYAVEGRELHCNFFNNLSMLSGANIVHVDSYANIFSKLYFF